MTQYLVFPYDAPNPDVMLITNASTPDSAKMNYACLVGIQEEWFRANVYTRSVNMSFSERFFLQSQKETDRFCDDGAILIDGDEFERRVRQYFPVDDWAHLYLTMWNDRETSQDELPARHPFPDDMLVWMYLHYDPRSDGLAVVPVQDLKRR